MLSARGQESDKIAALDAGADDYLTKPFSVGELLARLRVALRHTAHVAEEHASSLFTAGNLEVDLARRQTRVDGQPVHLTPTEYRLLTTLIKSAGNVLTHRQLLKEVWGPDCTQETHYLRVYVNQLRQKLGDDSASPAPDHDRAGYRLSVRGRGRRRLAAARAPSLGDGRRRCLPVAEFARIPAPDGWRIRNELRR